MPNYRDSRNLREKANISNLVLIPQTMQSVNEPLTAALVSQDKELNKLKLCSPSQNNLLWQQTISDEDEREQRNKQIDELYEMRNSGKVPNERQLQKNETSDIYPPQSRPYNPHFN